MSKTNTEFIMNLMDFNSTGALMHLFVLTAIDKYAQQVLAADDKEFQKMVSMINPAAWKQAAREAKKRLDAHLEPV